MPSSLLNRRRIALVALLGTAACSSDNGNGGQATQPTPPVPAIAIAVPATLSVRQGGTVTVPITIRRTEYTGVVFATLSGLPTGVVAPNVSSTSTNAFNIPLVADSVAALGAVTVRVTAQGLDVATQTANFSLTVTPR